MWYCTNVTWKHDNNVPHCITRFRNSTRTHAHKHTRICIYIYIYTILMIFAIYTKGQLLFMRKIWPEFVEASSATRTYCFSKNTHSIAPTASKWRYILFSSLVQDGSFLRTWHIFNLMTTIVLKECVSCVLQLNVFFLGKASSFETFYLIMTISQRLREGMLSEQQKSLLFSAGNKLLSKNKVGQRTQKQDCTQHTFF